MHAVEEIKSAIYAYHELTLYRFWCFWFTWRANSREEITDLAFNKCL
ncbi:hypothetical protein ECP030526011_2068 [Escherichia coli P0305260.11]|nr:hypothetical protein ECDEC8E_2515 [Escherichia coli DEC8E]EMZ93083.1 hypothetical protein ECP03052601_1891 [Escherichia coli P0305260.1]ENA06242.1 hypothetical protein ECP02994382_1780 [Escherichia coli P0299438.2]ENC25092.1 hypothetical protein ECP02994389_4809 [Escherichia coli P0299438.9]ENE08772.1 hypothetical protein ECP03052602_2103 [Escherichia coli P0305260.2]ENF77156.1 hypothetical protein ECP030526010_1956 [Escherichia coli P0305260.10]ENF84248.1 hypothetical protein ECP030526011